MRRFVAFALVGAVPLAVAALGLYMGVFALWGRSQGIADWHEVAWPYLRDQFPSGKAYECSAEACGVAMRVTFRAKIGFCNCATGVSDDEELERIGDLHLVSDDRAAMSNGREIIVGSMKGRSRPYRLNDAPPVYSIAFNNRCDVIVATAGPLDVRSSIDSVEHIALDFLNSDPVFHWAERALGF